MLLKGLWVFAFLGSPTTTGTALDGGLDSRNARDPLKIRAFFWYVAHCIACICNLGVVFHPKTACAGCIYMKNLGEEIFD